MRADLPLRCECGAVRGRAIDVHPAVTNRVACHCRGCRAYVAHLGREARMLDAHGGHDVFQICPAALEINAGADQIACLRMTPKGALRWYARCCRTPLAGTLDKPGVPFMSLSPMAFDAEALPAPLDDYIGPVRVRVNGSFPRSERRALKADVRSLLAMIRRYGWMCLKWRVRGDHLRGPFFDPQTGAPVSPAEVIGMPEASA